MSAHAASLPKAPPSERPKAKRERAFKGGPARHEIRNAANRICFRQRQRSVSSNNPNILYCGRDRPNTSTDRQRAGVGRLRQRRQ